MINFLLEEKVSINRSFSKKSLFRFDILTDFRILSQNNIVENKSHSIIIIIMVVAFFFTNDESVVGVLSFPPSSN